MSEKLSIEELYQRFDTILPGVQADDSVIPTPESALYFERISMDSLEEMHSYSTDERLYQYFEFEPFKTIKDTRAYLDKLKARMAGKKLERTAFYWFVRRKSDARLIGTAALVNLTFGRQSIEWGYGVDPELWGKGYILDLQEMLKHYVFDVLKLNRLYGVTMVENEPTIASVSVAGFKHEGILRQYYNRFGTYHDGWAYSMLGEEYFHSFIGISNSDKKITCDQIVTVVAALLSGEEVTDMTTMLNSTGWDSMSHISIICAISEEFGVEIAPRDVARLVSIKDIFEFVNG